MNNISFKNDIMPLTERLFRLAMRIVQNREEAEDIVQDTLMKLWSQQAEWADIQNIETYTLTMCRNLALDRLEKKERQNLTLNEAIHDQADNAPAPDDQLISRQQHDLARQLIDQLPEKQRTTVQLRDGNNGSRRESQPLQRPTETEREFCRYNQVAHTPKAYRHRDDNKQEQRQSKHTNRELSIHRTTARPLLEVRDDT